MWAITKNKDCFENYKALYLSLTTNHFHLFYSYALHTFPWKFFISSLLFPLSYVSKHLNPDHVQKGGKGKHRSEGANHFTKHVVTHPEPIYGLEESLLIIGKCFSLELLLTTSNDIFCIFLLWLPWIFFLRKSFTFLFLILMISFAFKFNIETLIQFSKLLRGIVSIRCFVLVFNIIW